MDKPTVGLLLPGRSWNWGSVQAILMASLVGRNLPILNNNNGWDDFNAMWCRALNAYEAGHLRYAAMLHDDVEPQPGWLDVLADELEATGASLVSVPVAIKDDRGLTSCGVGDPAHRFGSFRRFTVRELATMPETFSIADTPHPDKYLLHNTGCWIADLADDRFRATDADGNLVAFFDFPTRVNRNVDGQWDFSRESEDWFFSRKLAELGMPTRITRKVKTAHRGTMEFLNHGTWGRFTTDDDTRENWGA